MANRKHIEILQQGTDIWNAWRKQYPKTRPDLRECSFAGVNLRSIDFHSANLRYIDLSKANLSGANLSGANLSGADLSGADLALANFDAAVLSEANLSETDLAWANFLHTILERTNFTKARVNGTHFTDIDLRTVIGLDKLRHTGPSQISTSTLERSQGEIPEVFLRKAGLNDNFINYVRSLVGTPIQYYTCFISYSSRDQVFAERLYADLQQKDVRCWFAPEDLKIGDKFWHSIDESIRLYDKLLVVLSMFSVESSWVEREVMAALEKEQKYKKLVLFPVTLDEAVMRTQTPWAANLRRSRHIGDFTRWKDYSTYQQAFQRLLRDLKTGTSTF